MKETVWPSGAQPLPEPAALPVDAFVQFQASIAARSQLVWGEHCTECSFPACQFTCAFYTPRPDLTCQRFKNGIEPVALRFANVQRIGFRKWGKLEARGPATLTPARHARRLAGLDRAVAASVPALPLPFATRRAWLDRWNRYKARLSASHGDRTAASFVIEAWSPSPLPWAMTVTFLSLQDDAIFQSAFDVSNAYGRHVIPVDAIGAVIDLDAPYLVQVEPVGEAQGREIYLGTADFVIATERLPAAPQPVGKAKVIVWDLDNTLWDGTLAEDGVEGLRLREPVVAVIRELDRRGILHAIASKNDPEPAAAALEHFGIADLFLVPQIGWGPKSEAVGRIAGTLDLGLDSFVFIDDQAFERAEVTAAHPAVEARADTAAPGLLHDPRCTVPATAESARRRALYRAESERKAAFEGERTDYVAFVAGSRLRLDIAPLCAEDAERVYELSQRTNQLNFRGTRYTRADVDRLVTEPGIGGMVLRCSDRFGDYGVIGFVVCDRLAGRVEDFFMSCRIQRKFVEHALFAHLLDRAEHDGHQALAVRFRPSERNGASIRLLESLDFASDDAGRGAEGEWRRVTALPIAQAGLVSVHTQAGCDRDAA